MGPAIFILAILGCGDDNAPCQTVTVVPAQYQSIAACDAGIEDAIRRYINTDYPVVVAQCLEKDAAVAGLRGDEVKLPPPLSPAPRKRRTLEVPHNAQG